MELKVFHDQDNQQILIETGIPDVSPFKLFNAAGSLVWSGHVTDHEVISVKGLEKGIYQYKLIAGERLQVGKISL